MLRSNSAGGAYVDDATTAQTAQGAAAASADEGAMPFSEMLLSLSQEYSKSFDEGGTNNGSSGGAAGAGGGAAVDGDDDDDDDDAAGVGAGTGGGGLSDFGGDLFQLLASGAQRNQHRRIDRSEWEVSAVNSSTAAAAAAAETAETGAAAPVTAQINNNNTNNINDGDDGGASSSSPTITPEEGTEMFLAEIEAIVSVYGQENVTVERSANPKSHLITVKVQVLSPTDVEEAFTKRHRRSRGLCVSFLKPVRYPTAPLEPFIEPWHNIFTFAEVQAIYNAMLAVTAESEGGSTPALFNMVQTATSLASAVILDGGALLVDAGKRKSWGEEMRAAGFTVRLSHESVTPSTYVGSIAKWMCRLPRGYDVMLVENVVREDLAKRFEAQQQRFFKTYVAPKLAQRAAAVNANTAGTSDNNNAIASLLKNDPALAALADSRCVFHGTAMCSIGSIVSSGLVMPGTHTGGGTKVGVRSGSRYGQGIYCTPDPSFALNYAQNGRTNEFSVKLMVCAVLPGKSFMILDGDEPWGGGCEDGYDSHVSEDGSQIVVFSAAQILPCYVIHLMERRRRAPDGGVADLCADKTAQIRREIEEMRNDLQRDEHNTANGQVGGRHHRKGADLVAAHKTKMLTAMARKNLPFGFGPAGSNFVVEEIADYSDDDEDDDEYVPMTHDDTAIGAKYDEYQANVWNK